MVPGLDRKLQYNFKMTLVYWSNYLIEHVEKNLVDAPRTKSIHQTLYM